MEILVSGKGLYCLVMKLLPAQLLRVMRLTALLLLVVCMHVSAHSYSQNVSFRGNNVPISTVFASIEKQTGLSFFFNYALIKDIKPVTLDMQNVPLEEALNRLLNEQGLDYYRTGKTIFIVKKQPVVVETPVPGIKDAKQVDVKGRVINHLGESLVAATVTVRNGKRATLTNEKGEFELKRVPSGAVLEVSYLGYQKKEVEVTGDVVIVQLALAENQLDEMHVIAYGQTTQRLSTGNMTLIKGSEIEKQPVNNPLLALEGRVPGLFVTQTSGMPGSGVKVQLQGQNSIGNGNDPFYVIDGVPYISQTLVTVSGGVLPGSNAGGGGGGGNPLSYINPNDIESIEVLKDADATAIYGSRAANGAILITTKKGKIGKMKVSINLQNGWGAVTRKLDLMNTPEYLQMRHEALKNDGIATPAATDYDINGLWDSTRNTDWQKKLIGGTAQYSNLSGSVSGGNANMQYLVGGTYHRETSVFPGSFADQKGSLHFSLNSTSINQKFRMQLTGSYMYDNNQLPIQDLTLTALTLAPDAPALYNPDGSLNWQLRSTGGPSWTNPLANTVSKYDIKTNNLIGNAVLSYQLLPGLDLRANLGYTNLQMNEFTGSSILSLDPASQAAYGAAGRAATYSFSNINSWIVESQANYKYVNGNNKIQVLAGTSIQQNHGNGYGLLGIGYNSDALLPDMHSAASISSLSSAYYLYKYSGYFGRINYSWDDKYLVDVSARRDGSSRFGPANRFHNFASAGIGWIFTQEKYIKDNLSFISFGKIRGSYGVTGNDQIGDYRYLDLYNSVTPGVAYQGVSGLAVTSLPNPYLQWESTKKLQAGVELGFLSNRIFLIANYVHNRSSNQLLVDPLPLTTGFNNITANIPAVLQNTAEEFALNTINIKGHKFSWSSSVNLTIPQNKLVAYYGQLPTTYIIGKPLGLIKVFHSLGVNPTTGAYQFADSHGAATSSPSSITDKNGIVSLAFPKYYGGFQNSFQYKGFNLDFLLQFVKKVAANDIFGPVIPGTRNTNQPTSVLTRWQKANDNTSIQRYNSNRSLSVPFSDVLASDAHYTDASFIRLKNLSVSYQFSEKVLHQLKFQGLKVYVQGQNLLTYTKFKGLDPETGNSSLPPLRVLTFGLQADL